MSAPSSTSVRRKGSTSVSSQDYDRLYQTVQGLVQQASTTQASVAALAEGWKAHDERLQRIEGSGNIAVIAEALKALTDRVAKVEGAPAKWVTWASVIVAAFSAGLVLLGMAGGALVFLITHLSGG